MKQTEEHQGYEFTLLTRPQPLPPYSDGRVEHLRSIPVPDRGWRCFIWFKVAQPVVTLTTLFPNACDIRTTRITDLDMSLQYPKVYEKLVLEAVKFDETEQRCPRHRLVPRLYDHVDSKNKATCHLCHLDKIQSKARREERIDDLTSTLHQIADHISRCHAHTL